RQATVKSDGRQLKVALELKTDSALIKAFLNEQVPHVQLAAHRAQSQGNLKQLAVALHNYASANQDRFPPAWGTTPPTMFKDERKTRIGLSWRVHLLPFIEQDNLYKQFRLNESWDS